MNEPNISSKIIFFYKSVLRVMCCSIFLHLMVTILRNVSLTFLGIRSGQENYMNLQLLRPELRSASYTLRPAIKNY